MYALRGVCIERYVLLAYLLWEVCSLLECLPIKLWIIIVYLHYLTCQGISSGLAMLTQTQYGVSNYQIAPEAVLEHENTLGRHAPRTRNH